MIPPFAHTVCAGVLPPTTNPAVNHLIGMTTAIVLIAVFVSCGVRFSVYLFLASMYTSFLLASQLTLPSPVWMEDPQTLPGAERGTLVLLMFPCYFLSHFIIYILLRMVYQPQDLGGFGKFTLSSISYSQAVFRAIFCCGDVDGGVSFGFGPDREALASPPSYNALNQFDIPNDNSNHHLPSPSDFLSCMRPGLQRDKKSRSTELL